jgi:hypothetical protein
MTGFFGNSTDPFIECNVLENKWENNSMFGDIFPTLHVAAVIMHAVVVVIVFYRFPKAAFFPN